MKPPASVRQRALVSIVANFLRAVIAFVTSLLLARELTPVGYGDFSFLLGTFVAVRAFMDAGISNAFFTFISQRPRGWQLYRFYLYAQLSQVVLIIAVVMWLIPEPLLHSIWAGHGRDAILLAFCAAYMQQAVWQVISQVGEASRSTWFVQLANLGIALLSLGAVVLLSHTGIMSTSSMFVVMAVIYLIVSIATGSILVPRSVIQSEDIPIRSIAAEFWGYCKPMLLLTVFGGIYLFLDKWVLQTFGGAVQQGYFQIASQFSLISLLVTTSVLGVFWKEIAEATACRDCEKVARLYKYATRSLLLCSASFAAVAVPWTEEIVLHYLGEEYRASWPVVAVMLLCPIYQSLSQINGSFLMASSMTRLYSAIGVLGMILSIPLSYLAVAPGTAIVPGFEMGAFGIAIKEVGTTMLMVGIQSFAIASAHNWRGDIRFHVATVSALLGLGWLTKLSVAASMNFLTIATTKATLLISLAFSALVVFSALAAAAWRYRATILPLVGAPFISKRHGA